MLKYVQTQVPIPVFKKLKILALELDTTLQDLTCNILTEYANTHNSKKEETKNGRKETPKRSK